jgi:hypothetical protein
MDERIEGVTLQERQVGRQWLITSADLPGLHVAHADLATARRAVPAAIRMLREMAARHPAAKTARG